MYKIKLLLHKQSQIGGIMLLPENVHLKTLLNLMCYIHVYTYSLAALHPPPPKFCHWMKPYIFKSFEYETVLLSLSHYVQYNKTAM